MTKLLLIEDEPALQTSLQKAFELEGYEVFVAGNGADGLDRVAVEDPDVIVTDVMMPEIDGIEVCRRLRAAGDTRPVLMLTARDLVSDRVQGLDVGADDYVAKPFALEELLARVRALVRRVGNEEADVITVADVELDRRSRLAKRGARSIELSKIEYDLLALLMSNAGIVLTREVIFERVWGYDMALNSNSLEVFVGGLRRKLEEDGGSRLIDTKRGVGYVMRAR